MPHASTTTGTNPAANIQQSPTTNPNTQLPIFSSINATEINNQLDQILANNRQQITELANTTKQNPAPTWQQLIQPMEDMDDELGKFWSPISHLHSVLNSEELRSAYQQALPKLSDYATELGQNQKLFELLENFYNANLADATSTATAADTTTRSPAQITPAQKQWLENELRDFRLAGVALAPEQKKQYKEIQQHLTKLCNQFENNILDATQAWTKHIHITDEGKLSGIPEHAIATAKQTAEQQQKSGWIFTLEFPSYFAIISYADDRELREEIYRAYVTRASELGPNAGKFDNSEIMQQIVALRHQLAQLLGFNNFAEYSLATKMAQNSNEVFEFLNDLATRSKNRASQEFTELENFAAEQYQVTDLQAWDLTYYSEKLRQQKYDISQEQLRPYFPEDHVLTGMFEIINRLYGMHFEERKDIDTWHQDVRFFEIFDEQNNLRGCLYTDLYARQNKRGGAWMDECINRRQLANGDVQIPVAFLTCNFAPPAKDKPALFSHDEVVTLFHEMGHCLHHLMTQVNCPGVAGINGVPWDAVELPSQFFENWCWHKEAVDLISKHYKTGEAIPDELFNKLWRSKNFQSAMQMLRQLEFALFDFHLHADFDPAQGANVQQTLDAVRARIAVVKAPEFNRFQHGFSHIFAGGYAAGYYSYKWAEVLSSDAFSLFEEKGIFDKTTGRSFLHNILEQGGSKQPMELFVAFRGRKPTIDALLRHNEILQAGTV